MLDPRSSRPTLTLTTAESKGREGRGEEGGLTRYRAMGLVV